MSIEVIWSPTAKLTIAQNIDYIVQEWNSKILNQFLDDIELALRKIKQNPLSYPIEKTSTNVRKYKINKHIVLYYKVLNDNTIELVTFWNNKRNPKDLKF